jgi:hypothetical protein
MKRKKTAPDEPVISKQIIENAKASLSTDSAQPPTAKPCVVCGDDVAPNSTEELCWVCRRLKISAWHDSEQMPAQE